MSTASTGIAWTDRTWNPVRGCSRVSDGCRNCYAERVAARFSGKGQPYEGLVSLHKKERVLRRDLADGGVHLRKVESTEARWNGEVRLVETALGEPLSWRKPVRVFVNSMSDLFHESLTNEQIAAVFGVMAACPRHTFQVLTKRAERMGHWFRWAKKQSKGRYFGPAMAEIGASLFADGSAANDLMYKAAGHAAGQMLPLRNVHIGVSIENQDAADDRIPWLMEVPAALRFVSLEPLLGPVDLENVHPYYLKKIPKSPHHPTIRLDALRGHLKGPDDMQDEKIGWVIVGGESGPKARGFDVERARACVVQCQTAGVPVFVKQLGAKPYQRLSELEIRMLRLKDRAGADPAEWPADLRIQEFPR